MVGEKMDTPVLDEFSKLLISLFAHSPRARIALFTHTGQKPKTHSSTRWWLKFEVLKQVHGLLRYLHTFLGRDDLPEKTRKKLRDIVYDQRRLGCLRVELSVTVYAMEPFVKATYNLEGDGPLAVRAYQELRVLGQLLGQLALPKRHGGSSGSIQGERRGCTRVDQLCKAMHAACI